MRAIKEKSIHELFEISVILKGIHAVIEIVGGFFLLFVSTQTIAAFFVRLAEDGLAEDSQDTISNTLLFVAHQISIGSSSFAAFYLLSHGIIKIFLVIGLLRNKLWAYPMSIAVLILFVTYQMYRYMHTHSIFLVLLSIFDVILIGLVAHEYRLVRTARMETIPS